MFKISSYLQSRVVGFLAVRKKYVLFFFVLFSFWLFSSCHEQTGNAEKGATQIDSSAANETVAEFDSLAWADSLFAKGDYFFERVWNDSAIYYYNRAIDAFEQNMQTSDSLKILKKIIKAQSLIAESYRILDLYDNAFAIKYKIIGIAKKSFGENSPEVALEYHRLGNNFLIISNLDSAYLYYQKALTLHEDIYGTESIQVAETLNNLSIVLRRKSELYKALEYQRTALDIYQKNKLDAYDIRTGQAYHSLGKIWQALGYNLTALNFYESALLVFKKNYGNNHPTVAMCINSIASIYHDTGDYVLAVKYYKEGLFALSMSQNKKPSIKANIENNLGAAYRFLGDYENAFKYVRLSIETRMKFMGADNSKSIVFASNYRRLADIYFDLKNYPQALKNQKISTEILEQHYLDSPRTASAYVRLARIYEALQQDELAEKYFRRAISAFQHIVEVDPIYISEAYRSLGSFYVAKNLYSRALKYYDLSIEPLEKLMNENTLDTKGTKHRGFLFGSLHEKANGLYKYAISSKNDSLLEAASQLFQKALIYMDELRSGYQESESKYVLMQELFHVFEKSIQCDIRLAQATGDMYVNYQAFQTSEKSKAAILREHYYEGRIKNFGGYPDSLRQKERELNRKLSLLDGQIQRKRFEMTSPDSLRMADLESRYFNLKRDYEALKKQLETDYPEYQKLKYNTKVATVAEVQEALDENTLLLEYFYGDSAIYIFTLDKDSFEIVSVEKGEKLDQQIRSFRKAIIESDYALFAEKGRTLYRILLAPVAQYLDKKQLLIVPDGPLNYLPFEALLTRDINGAEMDFSNLPYLLNEYSVSYHYSATLWLETTLRKREKEPIYDYVAFAPVNWDSTVASKAVFATLTANRALDSTRALPVNLLSTRQEVLDIEAQFNEKYNLFASLLNRLGGNRTRVFLEDEATEVAAKHHNLEDYRYIHFATHGFANTAAPTLSGLLLADRKDSTALEDGVLRLGEVYNLKLNADLVVLSACETGYGKLLRGEGLLSLTRGFIYAGAKNLVVSLWKVDANSPSELIPKFFQGVLKGETKNAALRNAKLRLIQSGSVYAEPKHWAPFVLIGQ